MANQQQGNARSMNLSHLSPSLPPKSPTPAFDAGFAFTGTIKQHSCSPSTSSVQALQWNESGKEDVEASHGRRFLHRRSSSESAAFSTVSSNKMQLDDFSVTCLPNTRKPQEFDDEEQIMSMFTDLANTNSAKPLTSPAAVSDQSTQSENSSGNEMPIDDAGLQNEIQSGECVKGLPTASTHIDPNMDPKRAKRILANRQSAQRSRVRKLQYIAELERSVTALQSEVSVLTPQVAFLDHQRILLNVDNNTLKQRIAAMMQDKRFKDAHNDALTREVQRLRQVFEEHEQELRAQQQHQNGCLHLEGHEQCQ